MQIQDGAADGVHGVSVFPDPWFLILNECFLVWCPIGQQIICNWESVLVKRNVLAACSGIHVCVPRFSTTTVAKSSAREQKERERHLNPQFIKPEREKVDFLLYCLDIIMNLPVIHNPWKYGCDHMNNMTVRMLSQRFTSDITLCLAEHVNWTFYCTIWELWLQCKSTRPTYIQYY